MLKALQPCSMLSVKNYILTPVCKHNGFKVLHFTFWPVPVFYPILPCFCCHLTFLTLHFSDFFPPPIPTFLSTLLSFPSFLSPIPSLLSFHLFPLKLRGLRVALVVVEEGLLLLCPRHWYSAFTHWHCPDAWRLLLPWLRLMEKLHRLLFGTIVFTQTYLGRCCHSERLAAGEAEAAGGVGNYRQGTRLHSHLSVKHPQNRS